MEKKQCEMTAMFRFTWAGMDEMFFCYAHALEVMNVAQALGYPLQMIQLSLEEMQEKVCQQMVSDDNDH
jgi:hypothetical protein